jgi:DNA-binding transcriptional regulator YhcF (GntR family)
MRFWLSRRSPVSLREQIATQVMLGVISEDLKPGQRLPSVRELARLYRVHANTVSAAYRDAAGRGWIQMRKGSGVYARELGPLPPPAETDPADALIADFLEKARAMGIRPADVRSRLDRGIALSERSAPTRLVVAEPEHELGEIIAAEIRERTGIPATNVLLDARLRAEHLESAAAAVLISRSHQAELFLPAAVPRILLRLHSIPESLQGQRRPQPHELVSVVSRSPEVLRSARTVLLAAAIDPGALDIRDAREPGWRQRLGASAMIITDIVTGRRLRGDPRVRTLRVVADSSLEELRRVCELAR